VLFASKPAQMTISCFISAIAVKHRRRTLPRPPSCPLRARKPATGLYWGWAISSAGFGRLMARRRAVGGPGGSGFRAGACWTTFPDTFLLVFAIIEQGVPDFLWFL
jgi:hypothetical protein